MQHRDSLDLDFSNEGDDRHRLIILTVSLDDKITKNEESYVGLVRAIHELATNEELIRPHDFVLFNIGSPLTQNMIRSDFQRNVPAFEETF